MSHTPSTRCGARGAPSRWRSQRGQSTAMVVAMLFFLVLFVGVVVDVGQAVNRRIALQVVADAGAYTGATVMGIGLNNIAHWNDVIANRFWRLTYYATLGFGAFGPPPCDVADLALMNYAAARQVLGVFVSGLNLGFARLPYDEAHRVSRYNIYDLFPGELATFEAAPDSFTEWDPHPEVGIPAGARPTNELVHLRTVSSGVLKTGELAQSTVTIPCTIPTPPFVIVRTARLDLWYEKAPNSVDHFVYRVKSPPTQSLMFDWAFGPNAIPEMKAVGVAKPVGGWIAGGIPRYRTKMVPVDRVRSGSQIQDAYHYRGIRNLYH